MKRVAVRVTGRVQGVFFRDSTRDEARRRGLTGWVTNERDGSVSVEVQGSGEQVDEVVAWLRQGPPGAQVVNVTVVHVEPLEDEATFRVV